MVKRNKTLSQVPDNKHRLPLYVPHKILWLYLKLADQGVSFPEAGIRLIYGIKTQNKETFKILAFTISKGFKNRNSFASFVQLLHFHE